MEKAGEDPARVVIAEKKWNWVKKVLFWIRLKSSLFCGNLDPAGKQLVLEEFGSGSGGIMALCVYADIVVCLYAHMLIK